MSIIPVKKIDQILFAESHVGPWRSNAAFLALTEEQIAKIETLTGDAREKFENAIALRQQAKAATLESDTVLKELVDRLGDAIKAIRLRAESTNDPGVYAKAEIPAPAAPTAALPPTQPTMLRAVIGATGDLTIQWKVAPTSTGFDASTSGVIFTVRRRLAGETNFTIVGTAKPGKAGKRGFTSFVDTTLPANPQGLQYVVQGVRSSSRGPNLTGPLSDIFSVAVGTGSDDVRSTGKNIKLAA